MFNKVRIVRLVSNLIFFTPKKYISSYPHNKNTIIKQKHINHSFYTKRICFQFSNQTDINSLSQVYRKHGWSNEYIKAFVDISSKYQKTKDFIRLQQITQLYLQKLKENKGVDNYQYVNILYNTIYFYMITGKIQKFNNSLNILYDILMKNKQISKINLNGKIQHLQYKTASLLLLMNKPQQTNKWLYLFINKFQNFQQTQQITQNQRFHTYLYLSNNYQKIKKNDLQFQYIKKAFNLLSQGKVLNLNRQSQIACIFSYANCHLKYGDKQIANKSFDIVDKSFDWNTPNQFLANSLQICLFYASDIKLTERGLALLTKFQKVFQQKKGNKQYDNIYKTAIFRRIKAYLSYQKYQKIYHIFNNEFQHVEKGFPPYFLIYYDVLKALCQYKLGKIQDGQNSLQKAVMRARSIQGTISIYHCEFICRDIEFLEGEIEKQSKTKQKQLLTQIKALIMKAADGR